MVFYIRKPPDFFLYIIIFISSMYNLNRDRYTHIKVWTLFSNLQNVFRLSRNLQNRRQTCSPEISGILESSCRLLFCAFSWMFYVLTYTFRISSENVYILLVHVHVCNITITITLQLILG